MFRWGKGRVGAKFIGVSASMELLLDLVLRCLHFLGTPLCEGLLGFEFYAIVEYLVLLNCLFT